MGTGSGGSQDIGNPPPDERPVGSFMPPKLGATLGRYQILATLGHGAMATVFRARDPQLGRDVAIKVMGMAYAARGGASERFRREAHAVAALKHPGIVEIFDFVDATEAEPSYIVAELIEGPTLRKLMESSGGRLLPEFAALILLPLVEALSAAHDRGVIHRDVKPDNVMLETTGQGSRVVLTDFGVAHIAGMETMTATGAMVGSPAYMSPEQSRGYEVGPATDLWSLGTMLYEMVTGTVPFSGKDPYTVIAAILRGSFRPPSQLVATVGPEFEAMIMRCLKPRPADRYASAAALAKDLYAFTRSAGLLPEGEALRRYLDDPEAAIATLRPRVADAATARARSHMRRGQLARALAEIGHATAYEPNHAGANRLLRRLSAGRKVMRIVGVSVVLTAAVTLVWVVRPWVRTKPPLPSPAPATATQTTTVATPPPPSASPPPTAAAAPTPPAPPPLAAPPQAAPLAAQAATTPSIAKSKRRPHARRRSRSPVSTELAKPEPASSTATAQARGAPAPTTLPAPAVVKEPAPAPSRAPAPVPEVPAPRPGTIRLFAKLGFCYPSLDDHLPKDLMPVYRDVAPGKHKVFCSRTKSSPKEFAGVIDLLPGGRIERTVTEQGGRLTLARPR